MQSEPTPLDTAGRRTEPLDTTTATTTARGPLELACRDAGLPVSAETLHYLETLAHKAGLVPEGRTPTPADFRRAGRLYRKMQENPRRRAEGSDALSKRQAKQQLMAEHGLTSGRQWKQWKKQQQRTLRLQVGR